MDVTDRLVSACRELTCTDSGADSLTAKSIKAGMHSCMVVKQSKSIKAEGTPIW